MTSGGDDAPLRICHVVLGRCNPESANGVDKTAYHLARVAGSTGHDVTVYSLTNKPPVPIPGAKSTAVAPRWTPQLPFGKRFLDLLVHRSPFNLPPELIRKLLESRPDILHLHFVNVPQNVRLGRIARRYGIPYCVTINGGLTKEARRRHRWLKTAFRLVAERRYLEEAAFLHAVSEHDVRGLAECGIRNRIVRIPNGIDRRNGIPPRNRETLIQAVPDARDKRAVIFVGRLDPDQKGLDLLIRGLAQAGRSDVLLVLVGPDWRGGEARVRRLVEECGVSEQVSLLGPMFGQRKDSIIVAADAFVLTSRWEGSPFAVLEAASLESPLLLTAAADPSGTFTEAGASIAVEGTVESIAEGISAIAKMSVEELERMGAAARRIVEDEYDWKALGERMVDVYRSSIGP